MWTCLKCGRRFKTANQSHSCAKIDIADHFKNKPEIIKKIYDKIIETVNQIGEVNIVAVKSAIFLKTNSTYIEIKPKKKFLLIAFYLDKEVKEFPITRTVQLSKNRIVHIIHFDHPDGINRRVKSWLKQSYMLINDR
jgi:hypothetical protein